MKGYSLTKGMKKRGLVWKLVLAMTIIGIIVTVVAIRQSYYNNLEPLNASQRSVIISVPVGASERDIAQTLEEKGVIRAAWAFEWYVRNTSARNQLKAGTYSLRPNQSVGEIVTILTQGKVATDLITILPGQRLDQIKSALINNGGFSEQDVDRALDPDLYKNEPALSDKPVAASLEGYLYPESFQKISETSAETIVRASLGEMNKYLTPDIREAFNKQGLTTHEAIILASIIQQEVSDINDMKVVAQVFLTRLDNGQALESDPTAIYGALKDDQEPSLTYKSPYNTYLHKGLPPGPISNVTKEALEAVANPADTDYLYFVAGDDGTTYFSRTLEEHKRLTKEHCTQLCQ